MKDFRLSMVEAIGKAVSVSITAVLLAMLAISVRAQHPTQPTDTTNPEKLQQQQQSQRELQLRNLANQAEATKDPKRLQELGAEVEQDFQRILILHNQLARFILNDKPLDYGFVSDASAEIKKRASHLQKTLALNKPDEQDQERHSDFADARIRDAVATLCSEIKSFVTNPIIDKPGTVNASELMRARRDLQDVIELSNNLKKSADRLKKTSP